jgi:hypothetical protein
MSGEGKLDIAEIERAAFVHFLAGIDGLSFPLQEVWPGVPGRAYIYEMIRREFGEPAIEYARKLPIFTQH